MDGLSGRPEQVTTEKRTCDGRLALGQANARARWTSMRSDGKRDPSPPSRETSTIRVHHIFLFFYFHISFSGKFGPVVFSWPNYCLSPSFLLIPLLGFIGPFLLGPNEPYVHVCVCVGLCLGAFFWFGPQVGFHSLRPITGPI